MATITIYKPKFGTRQIKAEQFGQHYTDAGWTIVEPNKPETPKEVVATTATVVNPPIKRTIKGKKHGN